MEKESNSSLMQYAGLATQLLVSLGLAVWIGNGVDKKINFTIPIFIWLLPLLVLIAILVKVVKDTSSKK
jgi:hypothetical protein